MILLVNLCIRVLGTVLNTEVCMLLLIVPPVYGMSLTDLLPRSLSTHSDYIARCTLSTLLKSQDVIGPELR